MGVINGKSVSSAEAYFNQWLYVATRGNVAYSLMPHNMSVQFWCKECGSKLSVPYVDEFTIPADLQEYVKFHRHQPDPGEVSPASVGYKFTYTTTKPPVKEITWDGKALKLETPRDTVRTALKMNREGRRFR